MRKWMAMLLCLAQLAGLCGCQAVMDALAAVAGLRQAEPVLSDVMPEMSAVTTPAPTATSQPTPQPAPTLPQANSELVPPYRRYDVEDFESACDRLVDCTEPAEAVALYDRLYRRFLEFSSVETTAYIAYSLDVTDPYWSQEQLWSEQARSDAANAFVTACSAAMLGPCGDALRAHLGDETADYYMQVDDYNEREDELTRRESELVSEYYAAMAQIDTIGVSFQGHDWTMDHLNGEDGDVLYWTDNDNYWELYDRLMKAYNDTLGPIYVELVALRGELAALYGYDSYSDYAYENTYGRGYTTAEADEFCEQVMQLAPRYYDEVYYADVGADYGFASMDGEQLMRALGRYADAIDPLVAKAWDYLAENGLYALAEDEGCMEGGYTVSFDATRTPYIYMSLYGDGSDFLTLSHEFGHFIADWVNPNPGPLVYSGDYDLMEIHSNGLEALYGRYYPEIFGEDAPQAEQALLAELLSGLVDGCLYDEFQRRVYAAEELTLEDINRIYSEVCVEFGEYDEVYDDGWWIFVSHNYDSPLYYISYAASALAALQIWSLSREDYAAAVDTWRSVVQAGAYDRSYAALMRDCGLKSFADENAVEEVCAPVLDHLAENG